MCLKSRKRKKKKVVAVVWVEVVYGGWKTWLMEKESVQMNWKSEKCECVKEKNETRKL